MAKGRNAGRARPVAVDLFCGAGGMSLGFEQAGFDVLLGVDADGYHVAVHERNFPYGKTLCRSVVELTGADVIAALDGRTEVDVVFGGPPCQGFSHMGHRDAADPRNTLVRQFARVVGEVRPRAFVMENVPGMLAGAARPVLDDAVAYPAHRKRSKKLDTENRRNPKVRVPSKPTPLPSAAGAARSTTWGKGSSRRAALSSPSV